MGRQSSVTVVVGPCALLREGLGRILSAADFCIIATGASVDDVMPSLLAEDRPILFILDVSGNQDVVVRQVKLFREQHATARIALLADHDQLSDSNIVAAFRAGADAYFLKPSCDTFIKSLELVMLGETILPPAILSFILAHLGDAANEIEKSADVQTGTTALTEASSTYSPRLSAREQCILRCLIEGDSNKTIARRNDIAEATVKVHVKAILRKIRVNNRTQAAIWAMNHDSYIGGTHNGSAAGVTMASDSSFHRGRIAELIKPRSNGALSMTPTEPLANGAGHAASNDPKSPWALR
ncbi:two-component system, NarL family, nitrate/nitrite response regulator NarL [Rhizobiales bacterium GAS191]|nr:two-component system, NarL family, nitrate/nitrite response regulator NarL [Rhizobiales bacterium GAS113]SEE08680.1 two-component system, NarL family, nitrate/nitrite response regulator NarL [Rhizobiales bacterium GAS191]SEE45365.1 two component transcriptional regulator, LuxR family [Rhizobiales bacterium GAS188]